MAKTSMKIKQQRKQKFSTREYSRCRICGRPHAYLRKYGICRVCCRELAYKGQIPGVRKASWKVRNKGNYPYKHIGGHINEHERSNCRYAYKNP